MKHLSNILFSLMIILWLLFFIGGVLLCAFALVLGGVELFKINTDSFTPLFKESAKWEFFLFLFSFGYTILIGVLSNLDWWDTTPNQPIVTNPIESSNDTYSPLSDSDFKPDNDDGLPYVPSYNEDAHYGYDGSVIKH